VLDFLARWPHRAAIKVLPETTLGPCSGTLHPIDAIGTPFCR